MKRAGRAAAYLVPILFFLALYWAGLKVWFTADDLGWLTMAAGVKSSKDLWPALFQAKAQGTIRVLGDRLYFLVFYHLFGLWALPYRIFAFLTYAGSLVLLVRMMQRLTGSLAAGFWAAILWTSHWCLAYVMTWSASYSHILCGLLLLAAFHCFLSYTEGGQRKYLAWQWVFYLLGFGALEVIVVYPVLAASYAWIRARRYFRSSLLLFIPSVLFAVIHRTLVPRPESSAYTLFWDWSIFQTLARYWQYSVAVVQIELTQQKPDLLALTAGVLVTLALLGYTAWKAVRREFLPAFFLLWYLALLAPFLPLKNHVSEYYPTLPVAGLAMLAAAAVVDAWRNSLAFRLVATVPLAMFLCLSVPEAHKNTRLLRDISQAVKRVVFGVEQAHRLHPGKTILLRGVDSNVFWYGIAYYPFRLIRVPHVYLAPDNQANIEARPEFAEVSDFVMPEQGVLRGMEKGSLVVYEVAPQTLKNITALYGAIARSHFKDEPPQRVDVANPELEHLLGPMWHVLERDHRWTGKTATVLLGGPKNAHQRLYITGACAAEQTQQGPVTVTVRVEGEPYPPRVLTQGHEAFQFEFPLPPALVGRESIRVSIGVDRTLQPPNDDRELGLVMGVFQVR